MAGFYQGKLPPLNALNREAVYSMETAADDARDSDVVTNRGSESGTG